MWGPYGSHIQPMWACPYGPHMEPCCKTHVGPRWVAHMGPLWLPMWDPYGSHMFCWAILISQSIDNDISIYTFSFLRVSTMLYLYIHSHFSEYRQCYIYGTEIIIVWWTRIILNSPLILYIYWSRYTGFSDNRSRVPADIIHHTQSGVMSLSIKLAIL